MIHRRENMTQAEHSRVKSVLDDGKIKEWIRNAKIHPMTDAKEGVEQTALLSSPQYVFGRGFGRRTLDPDEDLILGSPEAKKDKNATKARLGVPVPYKLNQGLKRTSSPSQDLNGMDVPERPLKRRAPVAWVDQEV